MALTLPKLPDLPDLPKGPSGPGWRLPRWPGWSRLPREGRDTLFLLGVIAWTVLPHVGHLPAWCTALTALVLAHMPVGQPSLKQAARLAGRTALLGAPIMLLLFLLFPRIGPLWGVPGDAGARTGLSGEMRMGMIAELAVDDSIASATGSDCE